MEKNIKQICRGVEITKEECSYDGIGFQGLEWKDRLGAYQGSNKKKNQKPKKLYLKNKLFSFKDTLVSFQVNIVI